LKAVVSIDPGLSNGLLNGQPSDAAAPLEPRSANSDRDFMACALDEARAAEREDEVPVGAVVVLEGRIVGRGHNRTRGECDPTAHAEIVALRQAALAVGAQRLVGATVYTTVEPCFMCAGALLHGRVARVVWAVRDPKFGACASLGRVLSDDRLNHQVQIEEGLCADEARELLRQFFERKRAAARG
jgi:tRNA(adenine34) deaminase